MDATSLTPNVTLKSYASRQELSEALARDTHALLKADVESRGQASLAVSGGSTPTEMFGILKNHDLPWEKVFVTLADERWVPPHDADSNEKLVRDHLLPVEANFVPLANKATTPDEGEAEAHRNQLTVPRPLTATHLGMGDDGHTASLFPNHPALKRALDKSHNRLVAAVGDSPKPPSDRITLSYSALIESGRILLQITGESKKVLLLDRILPDGPVEEYPIRAFLRQTKVPVDIYWAP